MEILTSLNSLYIFILGLFFGSFLNLVADRINRDETFISGRSYCEKCHHTLFVLDLVPLFSFLSTKGRCRYCHIQLSWYYPISEFFTGLLFVFTYLFSMSMPLPYLLFYLFIVSCLIVIFLSDIKYGIIPDAVVYPAVGVTLLFQLFVNQSYLIQYVISAFASGGFFLFLFLITKGKGMGFGDVKFAFFMGLLLGAPSIIYALYISFLTAAFVSLILILWKKKHLKSTLPFGPFLVLGTLSVLLFPQYIDMVVQVILP